MPAPSWKKPELQDLMHQVRELSEKFDPYVILMAVASAIFNIEHVPALQALIRKCLRVRLHNQKQSPKLGALLETQSRRIAS